MSIEVERFESQQPAEKNSIARFGDSAQLLSERSNFIQNTKDATAKLVNEGDLPHLELTNPGNAHPSITPGSQMDFRDLAGTGRFLDRRDNPVKDLLDKLNGSCDGKAQPSNEQRQQEQPRLREHRAEEERSNTDLMRKLEELARVARERQDVPRGQRIEDIPRRSR